MSTFNPADSHEQSKADQAPGRPSSNPLLAFGSETGDPPAAEWASAKSGLQRLAEMSWRADTDQATPAASGRHTRTFQWMIVAALLLVCVLGAAYIYTSPLYGPMTLPDVEHPLARADVVQPVPMPPPDALELRPVPPPPDKPKPQPVRPTANPAAVASTARRASSSPAPAAGLSESGTAALNTSQPAGVAILGSLSINATPWADVWIDGKSAGQTPIGNLKVTLGTHEIIFRHPLLGEQRHTVQVSSLAPTRIAVDLRN